MYDQKVNALFFQLEWLRNQELKLWQTEQIEKIAINHWNQHYTAERLRKLENKQLKTEEYDKERIENIG